MHDIASIFDMYYKREDRCEPRWASLIIEAPPPPPGPQIAKDVNVFHI